MTDTYQARRDAILGLTRRQLAAITITTEEPVTHSDRPWNGLPRRAMKPGAMPDGQPADPPPRLPAERHPGSIPINYSQLDEVDVDIDQAHDVARTVMQRRATGWLWVEP